MKIISFWNQKGGSGKTTTTGIVAGMLARMGYNVLMIDADTQAHLGTWFLERISKEQKDFSLSYTLKDIVDNECSFDEALIKLEKNWHAIFTANTDDIEESEVRVLSKDPLFFTQGGDFYNALEKHKFDFVFIDFASEWGTLERAFARIINEIIFVSNAEKFSIDGIEVLIKLLNNEKKNLRNQLKFDHVVITNYNASMNIHKEGKDALTGEHFFGDNSFVIRQDAKIKDMQTEGEISYSSKYRSCKSNQDYLNVANYLLKGLK